MIKSKKDLYYYLECDRIALGKIYKRPKFGFNRDIVYKFERLLRKCEYYNNNNNVISRFIFKFYKIRYRNLSIKLGFSIPFNVFGPGLSIAHYGTIVINSNSRVGKNCRIQECVCLGTTNGCSQAPQLGNNVFIGSGAKLIGNITIGDNVCIGAGAVVTKSFPDNVTIGGVPAKIISNNNSHSNLQPLLLESEKLKKQK